MFKARRFGAGVLVLFGALVGASAVSTSMQACAPNPRYQRCSNGGECAKLDPKYAYCLNGHCVECVAVGSCGEHHECKDGECVESSQ
ncbi:MAG TPA: hypothetical protein VIK01_21825 [Polyangiaceae bacterium]